METWTILAPGPSLPIQGTAKGPIAAINNAILAEWPVDFWFCKDQPIQHVETMIRLVKEGRFDRFNSTLLCCPEDQVQFWEPLGMRIWPYSNINHVFCEQNLGKIPDVRMLDITITSAISRCIGLGATTIDLYGCDMAGTGYAIGEDADSRSEEAWKDRWTYEQEIFQKALAVWEPVEIIRK